MTISVSNSEISTLDPGHVEGVGTVSAGGRGVYRIKHTLASRFMFLLICVVIIISALAYGTVHYWALALFNLGALTVLILWVIDAWQLGSFRVSRNPLQLILLGVIALGLVQLLPLRTSLAGSPTTLSLDPNSTRLVLVQFSTLFVYFAATLVFIDTPRRLRLLVRTILIFGFCLALFGLTQSFTSPTKIYWVRELNQSTAFGPFINRHHFAGYMELTIALPLGLLFSEAIEGEKKLLYLFAAGLMGVALVTTGSRGGIISLVAEILFFVIVTAFLRKPSRRRSGRSGWLKGAMIRAGLALALVVGLFVSVSLLGGDPSLNRLVDSVNTDDPTTGRAHFWSVTLAMIKAHPVLGTGFGAFGVIYTGFDSRNGLFRLEQAHNDYLQVLSDSGVAGAALGLCFLAVFFGKAVKRAKAKDDFRRGVAIAAAGGCFAVLVHSFFDFTLHTTSNALLFLVLVALATINGRVEHPARNRRRRSEATPMITQSPNLNASSADVL